MVPPQPALVPVIQPDIEVARLERTLAEQVMGRSGTNFKACYHCQACANGCPFVEAMDYRPNQVVRLLQFGMREEVLKGKTIWVCLGCHTCSSHCPVGIDLAAVMDTLRLMAVATKTKLPVFHFSEVLALALGAEDYEAWFVRHIIDPRPLVEKLAQVA
jgi:heterodisulfide reductase subunit C